MRALALLALLLCAVPAGRALAHGLAPILVRVDESAGGRVAVRWSVPSGGSGGGLTRDGGLLMLRLPDDCAPSHALASRSDARFAQTLERFVCGRPLSGRALSIEGLSASAQAVVLRVRTATGDEHVRTLAGVDRVMQLPDSPGPEPGGRVFARYLRLGVEHIASGWDHLAFLACLALAASRWRALVWPVTSFTLAHSATLVLGALGLLRLPAAPVEACIALSVLWMAERALNPDRPSSATVSAGTASGGGSLRAPAGEGVLPWMTFAFGLLHGLGFAGALGDVGFRGTEMVWALSGFNLGVELGQLGCLVLWGAARHALGWLGLQRGFSRVACELVGVLAGYWVVERSLQVVGWG